MAQVRKLFFLHLVQPVVKPSKLESYALLAQKPKVVSGFFEPVTSLSSVNIANHWTRFEPRISGVRRDWSANWASTTDPTYKLWLGLVSWTHVAKYWDTGIFYEIKSY